MLRAIIIDDEQKGINSIKLLIEKFIKDVKVVAETTEPEKGIELIEDFKPEIVFLDIKMPHMDGFELLHQLKFKGFSLIFTTAHNEFGLQAIKNNALDYLLKPIDSDDLEIAISKVRARQEHKVQIPDYDRLFAELNLTSNSKIPFHTKEKVEYVNKNDIIRLESDSNYTIVYKADGTKFMISKSIGEYEQILCGSENNFMRVHQSHILNLKYVSKYIKDSAVIITRDNAEVPLSKTKKDDFIRWLDIH